MELLLEQYYLQMRISICVCVKKSERLYSDFQVKTNLQMHANIYTSEYVHICKCT